ncbi:hypothetical protein LCGC14_2550810, partial [marine sediment metagenome]
MNILLVSHSNKIAELQPYVDCIYELDKSNIRLWYTNFIDPQDLLNYLNNNSKVKYEYMLVMSTLFDTTMENLPYKFIIYDRIDGGQLSYNTRKFIKNKNVVGVIKNYVYNPLTLYNSPYYRKHAEKLYAANLIDEPQHKVDDIIDLADLKKIHSGYGFGAYSGLRHTIKNLVLDNVIDFDKLRKFNLHCCLGTHLQSTHDLYKHQEMALNIAKNIQKSYVKVGVTFLQYIRTMQDSYCVLSPWRKGEAAYRDYEALACGCILIKPNSSYIISTPN